MTLYRYGFSRAAVATGVAYAMIRPPSTLDCQIREIGCFNETAVASSIGLVRNATTGTPSTSVLAQASDPQRLAAQTNIDTAWSVQPTVGANYLQKVVLPATIGAGVIWTFDPYTTWAKNGGTTQLCLWNFGAGTSAALQMYVVIDE